MTLSDSIAELEHSLRLQERVCEAREAEVDEATLKLEAAEAVRNGLINQLHDLRCEVIAQRYAEAPEAINDNQEAA